MEIDKFPGSETSPPTHRVVSIVELLAAQDVARSSADIADTLGLNRSTVGGILSALQARGWVQRLPDLSYQLGPALLAISRHQTSERLPMPEVLDAELDRLAEMVGCGAALSMISGEHLVFVAVTRDRGHIPAGVAPGARFPLIPPAGAALVAFSELPIQRSWLQNAPAERHREFELVLEHVRRYGYSVWGADSASMVTLDVLADVVRHLSDDPAAGGLHDRVLTLLTGISGSPYDQHTLDDDVELPISYLTAPIFHESGKPGWELQIGPLRPHVTLSERHHYIDQLTATAQRLGGRKETANATNALDAP